MSRLKEGENTVFELHELLKRDTYQIAESDLCQLLLHKDANYPWFILVPKRADITEIFQLTEQEQSQLLKESSLLSKALCQVFSADKLNVAALGNVCPQLHVHHIVRFKADATWPAPVWGKVDAIEYTERDFDGRVGVIESVLDSTFIFNER